MFSDKEKRVFKFWNGVKFVFGDPMLIHMRFFAAPSLDFLTDLKLLQQFLKTVGEVGKATEPKPDDVKAIDSKMLSLGVEAMEHVISAARYAFRVEDYDQAEDGTEKGLTDGEVYQLFLGFFAYLDGLKKNIDQPQTLPNSTAPNA